MAPYTRNRRSARVPDDAAAGTSRRLSLSSQVGVVVAFHNYIRNRLTPYSRPPSSAERNPPPARGTNFTRCRHRSNGGNETVILTTTVIPPAAPNEAAAADNDDDEGVLIYTHEEEGDSMMLPATVDVEEVLVSSSPGVGGLMCRILRERIDCADVYYDDGVSVDKVDGFLRKMSCAEAAADGGDGEVCSVCQDDMCEEDRTVGILECGHRFHGDCIGKWLLVKNVCPVCRAFGIGCFT